MGGFTQALMKEYPQEQILAILKDRFKALDFRKDRAVGNNMYPNMAEELIEPRPEDTATLKKQLMKAVEDYRKDIDKEYLGRKLEELEAAPAEGKLDKAVEAFSAGATQNEVYKAITPEGEAEKSVPLQNTAGQNGLNGSASIRKTTRRKQGKMWKYSWPTWAAFHSTRQGPIFHFLPAGRGIQCTSEQWLPG